VTRGQERVDQLPLVRQVGISGRSRSANPPAGAAGELARRVGRPLQDVGDLVERHGKHVVEHEREPLGGRQRLQHHEERDSDRVGKQGLVLRTCVEADDRLELPRAARLPAAGAPRTQSVEADARYYGGEPAAEVRDRVGVRAAEPQPRLLNRVLRLARRAEHPVRDPVQVRSVPLELLCQCALVGHVGHISSSRSVTALTSLMRSM